MSLSKIYTSQRRVRERGCLVKNYMKTFWPLSNQWKAVAMCSSVLLSQNSALFLSLKPKDLCEVGSSHQLLLLLNSKERWGESQDRLTGWWGEGWTPCPALPESALVQPSLKNCTENLLMSPIPEQGPKWIEWGASLLSPPSENISARRRDSSLPQMGVRWCFSWQKDNGYPLSFWKNVSHQWRWGLEGNVTLGIKERDISSTVWACGSPCSL